MLLIGAEKLSKCMLSTAAVEQRPSNWEGYCRRVGTGCPILGVDFTRLMEGLKDFCVPEWVWKDTNGKEEGSAPSLGLTIDIMLIF